MRTAREPAEGAETSERDKPQSVDDYIAQFDERKARVLRTVRALCRAASPDATESLKWGSPAYSLDRILFVFSAHARHVNMTFTPSTREAFADELVDVETGKGTVKLYYDDPVPEELLARMLAYRVTELTRDHVRWM